MVLVSANLDLNVNESLVLSSNKLVPKSRTTSIGLNDVRIDSKVAWTNKNLFADIY